MMDGDSMDIVVISWFLTRGRTSSKKSTMAVDYGRKGAFDAM
jgi:hypothetical protein